MRSTHGIISRLFHVSASLLQPSSLYPIQMHLVPHILQLNGVIQLLRLVRESKPQGIMRLELGPRFALHRVLHCPEEDLIQKPLHGVVLVADGVGGGFVFALLLNGLTGRGSGGFFGFLGAGESGLGVRSWAVDHQEEGSYWEGGGQVEEEGGCFEDAACCEELV